MSTWARISGLETPGPSPYLLAAPIPTMTIPFRPALGALWLTLILSGAFGAEAPAGEEVVKMEAFNVTAYSGKIPIIDGFSGKDYQGNNDVVFNFARSFNKLLLGYHKKLVLDEIKHMQFRIKLGKEFEREMGVLSAGFGFGKFALDNSTWLRRERSIITRLIREPFFQIKALIVWDLDHLNQIAPNQPDSKYAADIHFNSAAGKWERRITDRWDVGFFTNTNKRGGSFVTDKTQGLNLDTQKGFHFIERGLPLEVPPSAFKEVKLTYPIFYSDKQAGEKELRYLQETFIANLHFIYDPFSWVARRDTRFRGGFISDCLAHIQDQKIYVDDRKWFDPVFARFLSDVITIKLQGAEEIYALHMLSKRLSECPRALGVGLDLLNWNRGEKREALDKPEAEPRISPASPSGFRFVLIDAYQRFQDPLLEKIKARLLAQKEQRKPIHGQSMLTQVIEELSGMPYAQFAERAKVTQEGFLSRHKLGGSLPPPQAIPEPTRN
jgi:hypothetical protein